MRAPYQSPFAALPEDNRIARRAERVRELLRRLRQAILFWADADLDPLRLLDGFPLSLCACYRLGQSSRPISGATFGRCAANKQSFHGLRPQLLLTGAGFIDDLILAPANGSHTPPCRSTRTSVWSRVGTWPASSGSWTTPTPIPRWSAGPKSDSASRC